MPRSSTVFDWSTRVTDRQTDGRTDGRAIAYSALSMLSRANKDRNSITLFIKALLFTVHVITYSFTRFMFGSIVGFSRPANFPAREYCIPNCSNIYCRLRSDESFVGHGVHYGLESIHCHLHWRHRRSDNSVYQLWSYLTKHTQHSITFHYGRPHVKSTYHIKTNVDIFCKEYRWLSGVAL